MANLRKTTKNIILPGGDGGDDIESAPFSSIHHDENAKSTTTTKLQIASDTNPTYSSLATTSQNPFFLTAIRRKVLSLLIDEDDAVNNANASPLEQIISVLRDIIVGSILGLLTISFIMFLDHRNIIHLQSAHNFRDAAFNNLLHNDPETISYMETNMDMKFMPMGEYNSTLKEIDKAMQEKDRLVKLLLERTVEGNEKKEVLDTLSKEYNDLLSNPVLGLDNLCGSCKWGGAGTCDERVQYLMNNYGLSLVTAKFAAMEKHESCRKA